MEKKISVIIPLSGNLRNFKKNIEIREKFYKQFFKNDVEFIFVLETKDEDAKQTLEEICSRNSWKFLHYKPDSEFFNSSKARNIGARVASCDFLCFEDADLIQEGNFYRRIIEEVLPFWRESPLNFLSFPVAYLSQEVTDEIVKGNLSLSSLKRKIKDALNFSDEDEKQKLLQHFVPCSSVIILPKLLFEFIGGFDENFKTWGGEDRDFVFRLLASNTRIKLPEDFTYTSTEYGERIAKYVGWRALWCMIGDISYENNFMTFHLFHEEREWRKKTPRGNANPSIQRQIQKSRIFGKDYYKWLDLPPNKNTKTFVIGRNPHVVNFDVFEAVNGFSILEEKWSNEKIISYVQPNSTVLFWNPYGSKKNLSLFKKLKSLNNCNVLIVERGALPESLVFDRDDLVIFSNQYRRELWDKEISLEDRNDITSYLNRLTQSSKTLEKNGDLLSKDLLEYKLSTKKYDRTVLVCLQLLSDTVTTQNVEGFIPYKQYLKEIQDFVNNKKDESTLVLIKNHPLSKVKINLPGAINVDAYHLHNLMELSDAVVVYNSGTGIIARAFAVPVITFGPNSYSDKKFTIAVKDSNSLGVALNQLPKISREDIIKFFYYLKKNLYSFGISRDVFSRETTDAVLRYPHRISFYELRIPGFEKKTFNKRYLDPVSSYATKRFFGSINSIEEAKRKNIDLKKSSPKKEGVENKKNDLMQYSSKKEGVENKKIELTDFERKIRKLRTNPHAYFRDSKYPILKPLAKFFKE